MVAIHYMNIRSKDLNLLVIFRSIWEERNVSSAARRLGMSQPAASSALNRLRAAFDDPLFVRVPRGVTPTPLAESLAPQVIAALREIEVLFTPRHEIEPATLEARLVIAGSDYYGQFVLPKLISWLSKHAPKVTVVARSLQGRFPQEELERGEVDMVIAGFITDLTEGFYRKTLFSEHFSTVVRKDHPVLSEPWTAERFCTLGHVLISPQGDLRGAIDVALAKQGLQRRVVAGIDNFFTPGWVVAQSDLALSAPHHLIEHYCSYLPLVERPLPFEVPGFSVVQIWHERTHEDPVRRWFRQQVQAAAPNN
jgi:DNA-binding transcriptional LysR family regulator